jgi:hypothetical protein
MDAYQALIWSSFAYMKKKILMTLNDIGAARLVTCWAKLPSFCHSRHNFGPLLANKFPGLSNRAGAARSTWNARVILS